MRTTVNFDPNLLQQAQALTGLSNRSELLKQALKALIEREAALRLSRLGGTAPAIQPITRRRPTDDDSC
jgi:metal-responsive CopG/Arc/MetJ family transcriptional regulator